MKTLLCLGLLRLVLSQECFFSSNEEFGKAVKEGIENARSQIKHAQPIMLPELPPVIFKEGNLNLSVAVLVTDAVITEVGTFSVHVRTWLPELRTIYRLTLASPCILGSFLLGGSLAGSEQDVTNFRIDLKNFTQTGHIHFGVVHNSLQIQSISLDYDIKELEVNPMNSDLNEDVRKELFQFLGAKYLEFTQENKFAVVKYIEIHLTDMINQMLEGKSKEDLFHMLKKGTP